MSGPQAFLMNDGQNLHLQHGPIDLIISAEAADNAGRQHAFDAATARFDTVLSELVAELSLLKSSLMDKTEKPNGAIALRMDKAARRHMERHKGGDMFITRMAGVAGGVADEILSAMVCATPLTKAYVNNGGDIALHLEAGQCYSAAIAGLDKTWLGKIDIAADTGVCGIATSGQGGRSHSLGIADSVTVLGVDAAAADVAATLIANAVNVPDHPAIMRTPAIELQPDSDLGEREVVTFVGQLSEQDIATALDEGLSVANDMYSQGLIIGASLTLRGGQRMLGGIFPPFITITKDNNIINEGEDV